MPEILPSIPPIDQLRAMSARKVYTTLLACCPQTWRELYGEMLDVASLHTHKLALLMLIAELWRMRDQPYESTLVNGPVCIASWDDKKYLWTGPDHPAFGGGNWVEKTIYVISDPKYLPPPSHPTKTPDPSVPAQ